MSQFDDELRVRIARAIYGSPHFRGYGSMVNPPIHIIVEHGRVTLEGVVNNNVDRMIARSIASSLPRRSTEERPEDDAGSEGRAREAVSVGPPGGGRPEGRPLRQGRAASAARPFLAISQITTANVSAAATTRGAEEQQRRVQDRPRLHVHLQSQRLAFAAAPPAADPTPGCCRAARPSAL